jgi:hypothetical protein
VRGGQGHYIEVSKEEYERIRNWAKVGDGKSFLVFRSGDWYYSINPKHLIGCSLHTSVAALHRSCTFERENDVLVYLAQSGEPKGYSCK